MMKQKNQFIIFYFFMNLILLMMLTKITHASVEIQWPWVIADTLLTSSSEQSMKARGRIRMRDPFPLEYSLSCDRPVIMAVLVALPTSNTFPKGLNLPSNSHSLNFFRMSSILILPSFSWILLHVTSIREESSDHVPAG